MVLVRDWRAEQREDAVASGLRDVAALVPHRLHHQPERWVGDGAGFLGVEVFDQVHRALDVGEQRGDGLALAFQRRGRMVCSDLASRCGSRSPADRSWRRGCSGR